MSVEDCRPRLPAELRGEGVDGGGEPPGDCADAGRKLASKFYQLSAEEVGVGPGAEDGCGGRDRDPEASVTCGALAVVSSEFHFTRSG